MQRPSFQFYPNDWRSHVGLKMCSLAARGLWADMLCIMHNGTPYGYLTYKGKGILPGILARLTGATLAEIEGCLAELEAAEIFSRTPEGVIFSRRMVRDEHNRQVRAAGGVKALENPNVPQPKRIPGRTGGKDTFLPSPSSSSSSSSSLSTQQDEEPEYEVVEPHPLELLALRFPDPHAAKQMLASMMEGMGGPGGKPVPVEVLVEAGQEISANGQSFNSNFFKACVTKVMARRSTATPGRNGNGSRPDKTLEAAELVRVVRRYRNPQFPHTLTQGALDNFGPGDRRVIEAVGVGRILADDPKQDSFLVSQVAKMLAAVDSSTQFVTTTTPTIQ